MLTEIPKSYLKVMVPGGIWTLDHLIRRHAWRVNRTFIELTFPILHVLQTVLHSSKSAGLYENQEADY